MKKILAAAFIVFLSAFAGSTDAHAVALSDGYSCDSGIIDLHSKVVTYKKAKASVKTQITNLNFALAKAKKSKRPAIKAKIAALKVLLTQLAACAASPTVIYHALNGGTFSGQWNNTTFSTSGALTASFGLTGDSLLGSVLIGGHVFGMSGFNNPGEISVHNDPSNPGSTVLTLPGTTIGDMIITLQSATTFHVDLTNIPAPANFVGHATLDITVNGNSVTGAFHSYLVDSTKLADGTVSLTR
jgi:hypothetical protein